ncbi:MAG: bifunctional anthranilate synthase component I family protein/class IV aminotransferase [Pseudomonadota bacterium]
MSYLPASAVDFRSSTECFALLDDAQAGDVAASSRLYTGFEQLLECADSASWPALLQQTQSAVQQGRYAVALFSYETGAQLHAITRYEAAGWKVLPSRVLLFSHCRLMTPEQVQSWLDARIAAELAADIGTEADTEVVTNKGPDGLAPRPAGIANIRASVDEQAFSAAIAQVRAYIAAGDTYQVNYTYRLHFDTYGSPLSLYRRLRQRQPVPYGALIILQDGAAVLSLSPELFVRHTAGTLTARPMKGTAAATGDAQEDGRRSQALAEDSKNRAENLMIVDLLRNDLGQVAVTGSVRVPRLFEVTRFSSVLQMTSTVEAALRPGLDLQQILTALYPCGSITGAPKHRTMQIIRELETEPRGLYTGAIGWFDPPPADRTIGDFCLSVPIRTLQLQPGSSQGRHPQEVRAGVLGVGAGIVHDSVARDEYAECRLKAGFLTGLPAEFELFETMHATHADGCRHLPRHLQRLRTSAAYFGFAYDETAILAGLDGLCRTLADDGAYRVRLALQASGEIHLSQTKLQALTIPARVLLASRTISTGDLFLRHKSSVRHHYDQAWRLAEQQGAFDMLFFNEHGYLTEGGRSNVLLQKEGRWTTPPLSDGVLPGVMRSVLMEDPAFRLTEKSATLQDLRGADRVMLCNALRGVFAVEVVG